MLRKCFSLNDFIKKEAQYDNFSGFPEDWEGRVPEDWGADDYNEWEAEQVFQDRELGEEEEEEKEWLTIEPHFSHIDRGRQDGFEVVLHGTYEESSVLAGQPKRQVLDFFDTIEEAQSQFPNAEVTEHSTKVDIPMPDTIPDWFDPGAAGEVWSEEDY